jgi:hypothetical protein
MWSGWYRLGPREVWQRAVEAPSRDACALALDAFLAARGLKLHNLDVCLTGGGVPTVPPREPDHEEGRC